MLGHNEPPPLLFSLLDAPDYCCGTPPGGINISFGPLQNPYPSHRQKDEQTARKYYTKSCKIKQDKKGFKAM